MNTPTMLTYIEETPMQLAKNTANRKLLTKQLVDLYVKNHYSTIWIVACGFLFKTGKK